MADARDARLVAGTILVSDLASGNRTYVIAMGAVAAIALVGLAAAWRLPGSAEADAERAASAAV